MTPILFLSLGALSTNRLSFRQARCDDSFDNFLRVFNVPLDLRIRLVLLTTGTHSLVSLLHRKQSDFDLKR